MDLFETLGLGPRQPEENELYIAIYVDPTAATAGSDGSEVLDLGEAIAGELASEIPGPVRALDNGLASSTCGLPDGVPDHMELLRARCMAWLLPYLTDYVWNKDPLVLRASSRHVPSWERRRGPGGIPRRTFQGASRAQGCVDRPASNIESGQEGCVWSVMRFGDAVDDEWWVVWLLLRMTRELQDLSVQVWDNDGQFLLIEAAYALPRWLKPETAENRVWLRHGRLHIIPLASNAAPDLPASPTVAQALVVLREGRLVTASQRVQRPIDQRLEGYPDRARSEQQHVARCLLPVPLAAALTAKPQLVSELVEAFYLRDADDMRIASRMCFLSPSLERTSTLVRMTRCHYAQLAAQRFSAPRGLSMPPPDSPMAKAADLGLKLTVAAEIICARNASSVQQQQQREAGAVTAGTITVIHEARFAADPTWRRFKSSLEAKGYFQGNIPGSQRYKELLATALEAYAVGLSGEPGCVATGANDSGALRDPRRHLAELVLGAAATGAKVEGEAGGATSLTAEDDGWLDQQPDRLQAELDRRQAELNKHVGRPKGEKEPAGDAEGSQTRAGQQHAREVEADDIAAKMRGFMEQLSGLEGAEISGDRAMGLGCSDGVDFNPARFLRELEGVLGLDRSVRQRRAREVDDGAEDEDYGEGETSTEEGSSFFSSDDGESDTEEGEEAMGETEERENIQALNFTTGKGDQFPASRVIVATTVATAAIGTEALAAVDVAHATAAERCPKGLSESQNSDATKRAAHGVASRRRQEALVATEATAATIRVGSTASNVNLGSGATRRQQALKRGFLWAHDAKDADSKSKNVSSTVLAPKDSPSEPARMAGMGVNDRASGADVPGLSSQRQELDWEVRTATDSDDEDIREGEQEVEEWNGDVRSAAAHGKLPKRQGEECECDDGEDGHDHNATAKLLAALGVGTPSGSSGGDSDGEQPGCDAAVRYGASQQLRGAALHGDGAGSDASVAMTKARIPASNVSGAVGSRRFGDADFMTTYDSAMQAELVGTTLAQSFDAGFVTSGKGGGSSGSGGGGLGRPGITGAGPATAGLEPVDLDMNLVRNLLRSYTAQQGSAGPAGNMAAILGMSLVAGDIVD